MTSSLRLWLLGSWKAKLDDTRPIVLPTRQTRMLLARLALSHPHPVAHATLIADLCPHLPPDLAAQRMRSARYYLRRALRDYLWSDGEQMGLDPALDVACDVVSFEAGTGPQASLAALQAAVQIYRGPFLDPPPDGWAASMAQHLQVRFIETLQRLIAVADAADLPQIALDAARRWASEEPWESEAHRAALRALVLLGDHAAAEAHLARARALLQAEWGADQRASLDDLAHAIGRMKTDADLAGRPATGQVSAAAYQSPSWDPLFFSRQPLYGRAAELERLGSLWDLARQGQGQAVAIEGLSGIGKSRLAWELSARVRLRSANVVLWSTCNPYGDNQLLALLRNAVARLAGTARAHVREVCAGLDAESWLALATAIPELASLLPERPAAIGARGLPTGSRQPHELIEAFICALAAHAPVLLVLEDGHYAHPETLARLREIAGSARHLLLVVVRRAEHLAGDLDTTAGRDLPNVISLGPIEDSAMRALIREALGGALAPDLLDQLVRRSGGIPLFARDALYTIEQQSLLRWRYLPDRPVALADTELPESVAELLTQRLKRLSPAALRLAQLLAVLERPAGELLIAQLWDGAETPLDLQAELLEQWIVVERNGLLSFDHGWLRERVLELIDDDLRVQLHRTIAATLRRWPEVEPTELLHHYIGARSWDAALDEGLAAAARASSAGHMAALTRHLQAAEQAAAALDLAPRDPRRWDLLCLRERDHALTERGPLWQSDLLELWAIAEASQRPDWRIDARIRRGRAARETGHPAEAVEHLACAVAMAGSHGLADLQILARINLAEALADIGDLDRALAECSAAHQASGELAAGALRMSATAHLAAIRMRAGQVEQAFAPLAELLADPATKLHPIGATRALATLGALQVARRDYESGLATLRASVRHAQAYGDLYGMLLGQVRLCAALTALGRHEETIALGTAVVPLARRLADPSQLCALLCSLAQAHLQRGHHAAAAALAQEAVFSTAYLDLPAHVALSLGITAGIALAAGRLHDAREAIERLTRLDQRVASFHHVAARVWLALGRTDQARAAAANVASAAGVEIPGAGAAEALWDAAEVLAAIDGSRAAAPIREQAYQRLVDDLAHLADPPARRRLIGASAAHRALASYAASGPRRLALLPLRDAPTGRPLHDDELAPVVCTIVAPDDPADGAERRRAQIGRLVAEAAEQGGVATVDALASMLAVASRTIKRDLQELRRRGEAIATRRNVLRGLGSLPAATANVTPAPQVDLARSVSG